MTVEELVNKQIEESRARTPKDVWEAWVFIGQARKVVHKLQNKHKNWFCDWDFLENDAYENPKATKRAAVRGFKKVMNTFAGPAHCELSNDSETPVDMTAEEKDGRHILEIYGGGFYYLDESDIQFLNDNGYVVVMGPKGPECRVDRRRLP